MKLQSSFIVAILAGVIFNLVSAEEKTLRDDKCGDDLTYSFKYGTLTVRGTGPMYRFSDSNPPPWFSQRSSIQNVEIENGVTFIGDYAFQNCYNIVHAVISKSVVEISYSAFYNCTHLEEVIFSEGLETINSGAFMLCTSLTSLTFPDTLRIIGQGTFSGCSNLQWVYLPSSVQTVGDFSFSACTSLYFVFFLGSQLSTVVETSFNNCHSLESVCVLPDYKSTTLGGKPVTSDASVCPILSAFNNHCYEPVRNGTALKVQKRDNATSWEDQTNGCFVYRCINESGGKKWSKCNNTDGISFVCVDDKCVQNKTIEDKGWSIRIDINKTKAEDVNVSVLLSNVEELSNVGAEKITIGMEIDDDGFILRVIFYLDDAETASVIADAVKSIDKGEGCEYGVLCKAEKVEIKEYGEFHGISSAEHSYLILHLALLTVMSVLVHMTLEH